MRAGTRIVDSLHSGPSRSFAWLARFLCASAHEMAPSQSDEPTTPTTPSPQPPHPRAAAKTTGRPPTLLAGISAGSSPLLTSPATMELTLTGATLSSSGGGGASAGDNGSVSATKSSNAGLAPGGLSGSNNASPTWAGGGQHQQQQQQHGPGCSHDHSHSHGHPHGHSQSSLLASSSSLSGGHQQQGGPIRIRLPANLQSLPPVTLRSHLSSLASNPPALFLALVGTIKVGSYESFKTLADGVRELEREGGNIRLPMMMGGAQTKNGDTGDVAGSGENDTQEASGSSNDSNRSNNGSILSARGSDGHTLPHWAAKRSDDVRFLEYLSKVPNVNLHTQSLDSVGMYPVHWAATEGSIALVAFLISHLDGGGGRRGVDGGDGKGGRIVESPHDSTDSARAARAAQDVSNGAAVAGNASESILNSRDASGCTPLLIASQYGRADLAAFLLKRGASARAVDSSHDSALHWAAYKGSVPVCGLLLHLHGVSGHIDGVDAFGQTPLHLAALRGNVEVVQHLLEEAEAYMDRRARGEEEEGEEEVYGDEERGAAGGGSAAAARAAMMARVGGADRSFAGYLLMMRDRDGKTALDLAIKKKKTGCEVVLREYMDRHCLPRPSTFTLFRRACMEMFSVKAWKVWMGLNPEAQSGAQSPKFPFYFVVGNMIVAFLYYPFVFLPVWSSDPGILWDIMGIHIFSLMNQMVMWASFILTWRTDPGTLGNAVGVDFAARGSAYAASCGLDPNADIRSEMDGMTRSLRRKYDETLEEYSKETKKKEHAPLCHSCHIAKPLRSKHCRVSRRCILLFDHHCPFVGATIGLYNYRYFYLYLLSLVLALICFIATLITYTVRSPKVQIGTTIVGALISIIVVPSGGMLAYHTQLVWRNLTTNEHQNKWRYKYFQDESGGGFHNPFDHGCFRNFISRCFPGEDSFVLFDGDDGPRQSAPMNGNGKMHAGGELEMASRRPDLQPSESVISSASDKGGGGGAERRLAAKRRKSGADEEKKQLLRNVV